MVEPNPYQSYSDKQLDLVEYEDLVNSLETKKRLFFKTLLETFGNVTQTCQILKVSRACYYHRWLKEDTVFRYLVNSGDFEEMMIDFAEQKLLKKIEGGDIAGIIFFLKTRGKKRGYVEKTEIKHSLSLDEKPSWFDAPAALPSPVAYPDAEDAEVISITSKEDSNAS